MPPVFDAAFRLSLETLFAWRRDVRRFRPDALPDGALDRLLATANLAPSVGLSQPWRFVIVDDPDRRAAIRMVFEDCNRDALASYGHSARADAYAALKLAGLDQAPCQFALFADHDTQAGHGLGRRTMPEMIDYSAVMALHTLWLAARAEGIGLGWVSILDPVRVIAALDLPGPWRLIGYFCLGWPEEAELTPELQRAGWETRRDSQAMVLRR